MDESNSRRKIPPHPLVVVLPPKADHIALPMPDTLFLPRINAARREALRKRCDALAVDLCLGLAILGEMDEHAE